MRSASRGDSEAGCLSSIVLVAIAGWFVWNSFGGEREGQLKYDDCREVVDLKPDSFQRFTKTFTCSSHRTKSGHLMNATCVHIDTYGTLFSANSSCATAYVYMKPQDPICTDPKFPYLTYEDKCSSWPQ